MALYELGVILDPEVTPEEETEVLERLEKLIGEPGGSVLDKDAWGRRQLAYPIKKKTHGVYHFWKVEMPESGMQALQFELRMNDHVMRSLVLNMDKELKRKRKRVELEKVKAAKKAAKQEAVAASDEE